MITKDITIYHQNFTLHPSGVVYWQETDMLLIADVHLGKVMHFRKHGSAVPKAAMYHNFKNLDQVIQHFNPSVICFLGDLFHSYVNSEWVLFEEWVKQQQQEIILVTGNHDVIDPNRYDQLGIHCTDEWQIGSILLTHHPEQRKNTFTISGHIHPGIQLRGLGKQSLSVPCFHIKPNQMVLPAFGAFTGKYIIIPQEEDDVFAIADNEVIPVTLD